MKIFYDKVTAPMIVLQNGNGKIEELPVPKFVLETLHANLRTSTNILPASARKFQTWTIGFLDR